MGYHVTETPQTCCSFSPEGIQNLELACYLIKLLVCETNLHNRHMQPKCPEQSGYQSSFPNAEDHTQSNISDTLSALTRLPPPIHRATCPSTNHTSLQTPQ